MPRDSSAERLLVLTAALVCVAGVFGVLVTWVAERAGAARPDALGWLAATAIASGGALVWLLLARDDSDRVDTVPGVKQCRVCGRDVADTWRLCPNCGSRIEDALMLGGTDSADGAAD